MIGLWMSGDTVIKWILEIYQYLLLLKILTKSENPHKLLDISSSIDSTSNSQGGNKVQHM